MDDGDGMWIERRYDEEAGPDAGVTDSGGRGRLVGGCCCCWIYSGG